MRKRAMGIGFAVPDPLTADQLTASRSMAALRELTVEE